MGRLRTGDIVTRNGHLHARVTYMGDDGKRHALWRAAKNRTEAKRLCRQLIREMGDIPGVMKARSGRGYIYALRMSIPELPVEACPIKIGYSCDVASRTRDLAVGSPYPTVIIGKWATSRYDREEQRLHSQFAAHKLQGEWFQPAPEILDLINRKTQDYHAQIEKEVKEVSALV